MSSSPKKPTRSELEADWLKLHGKLEHAAAAPLTIYFVKQARRIAATINRAKITAPGEFAIYFDEEAETKRLTKLIEREFREAALWGAARAWGQRPRSEKALNPFVLPKAIVTAVGGFLRELGSKTWWKNIAAHTSEGVGQAIARGVDQGMSIPNIAKQVGKELKNAAPIRAVTIARTETTGAMNAGHQLGFEAIAEANDRPDFPIVMKEWLSLQDDRVREDHLEANGQKILADDKSKFNIGGEYLRFPGDPDASAAQRINCRCTVVLALEERKKNYLMGMIDDLRRGRLVR